MIDLRLDYAETRKLRSRADRLRCTVELLMRDIVHPGLLGVHNVLSQYFIACEELLAMTYVTDEHIALLNTMIRCAKGVSDKHHPHPRCLNFNF